MVKPVEHTTISSLFLECTWRINGHMTVHNDLGVWFSPKNTIYSGFQSQPRNGILNKVEQGRPHLGPLGADTGRI
jgi:hypothetical protein